MKLEAEKRKKKGSQIKKLKEEGLIPAILYGSKIKDTPLKLKREDFIDAFRKYGETSLVPLKIKGKKKEHEVLIYDIQFDPITDKVIHVDFFHPSSDTKVEAEVPLVFKGEAPAVSDLKGTLVKEIRSLKIKGFPKNLPDEIEVDVSELETFEDRIYVKDLNIPEDLEIFRDEKDIISLVLPPREEEEIEAAEKGISEEELFEEEELEEEELEEGEEAAEEEPEEEKEESQE